jgi:hypothetical protein
LDIDQSGFDRNSGAGIASAGNSLHDAGVRPSVFLELGTVTASGGGGGAINPGGNGTLTAQLINNGGAGATAITGTLTSSTPGVTITQGSSAYPAISAGGTASNTTPYSFDVSPIVPCGSKLNFSESVRFTGRGTSPTALAMAAPTGTASSVATTVAYAGSPVAIPDGDPVGVDIPFTVSGVGALSKLVYRIDGTACTTAVGSTTVGVNHSFVGDLTFKLRSPAGTTVTMIDRAGGELNSGNNFCQTVLSDGAATSIQSVLSAGAPYTGSFAPAKPLAAFAGESADGTWTLNVSDEADFDIGTVRAFSVDVSGYSCTP